MRSRPRRALILALPPLLVLSSGACVAGPRINLTQDALPCWEIIKATGLLDETPAARFPVDDTVGEIASFGDRQTGQLDKANADKRGVVRAGDLCEGHQRKAMEKALERTKPWWRF